VLNIEVVITTNEGVLKLMMNKEKKTEGLEVTIKLLGKYLVWKR